MRRAALVAGAAVAGGAVVARVVDRRWAAADEGGHTPSDFLLPRGRSFDVKTDDGAVLAVTDAGPVDAPMVVLPHCWMCSREAWAPVAHRLLAAGHRVVLYDQRGHGSSTCGSDGFTIERLGGDLRAVLEAVDAREAVLAGHSMGGMTIQSLASHHPEVLVERARAIALVATAASGLGRGARIDSVSQAVIASKWLDLAMRSKMGHALTRSAVGRRARRTDMVLTRDLVVACPAPARREFLAAMFGMDLRPGIAGIKVPTKVVIGTWDTLTPVSRARELVGTIPGAELVALPRFGHMLPLEAPDEVADVILSLAASAS